MAERLVEILALPNRRRCAVLGSVGQADLAPLADLSGAVFADVELAAGEGLALITGNPFSTAWAALALADLGRLLDALDVAGALSLEGLGANLSGLHPAVEAARPQPGLAVSLGTLRACSPGVPPGRRMRRATCRTHSRSGMSPTSTVRPGTPWPTPAACSTSS